MIVRAAYGTKTDLHWSANAAGASTLSWWGAYQYLPAGTDPAAAAAAFTKLLAGRTPNVVVLDLEEGSGDQGPRQRAWLAAMHAQTEWTYSGLYFARSHGLTGVQWIAAYQQTSEPTTPHELWQYTGGGYRCPGIAGGIDASIFHGTLDDLISLTGGTVALTPDEITAVATQSAVQNWTRYHVHGPNGDVDLQTALSEILVTVMQLKSELDAAKAEIDALKAGAASVDVSAIAEAVFQRFKAQADK